MREYPVLMRGPLVRASLEDIKTQTRRIVKPQPEIKPVALIDQVGDPFTDDMGRWVWSTGMAEFPCPYGRPGDRLWVRETWRHGADTPDSAFERPTHILYRATDDHGTPSERWRPSIHMPRWACRLLLEVVSVRVERLQDISEADAMAEGITERTRLPGFDPLYAVTFAILWNEINDKRYSWEVNPWVWRIEYKRIAQSESEGL